MRCILLVGSEPPSVTTGARHLYSIIAGEASLLVGQMEPPLYVIIIHIIFFLLYDRPFWPPGGPALHANVTGQIRNRVSPVVPLGGV